MADVIRASISLSRRKPYARSEADRGMTTRSPRLDATIRPYYPNTLDLIHHRDQPGKPPPRVRLRCAEELTPGRGIMEASTDGPVSGGSKWCASEPPAPW